MPRPRLPESEKTEARHVRFKQDELKLIEAAALAEGLPVAAYIRRATMEYTKEAYEFDGQGQQ
jgi:hypothetical protein